MDNEITIPPPARRGWSDDARAPGCGRGRHVTASRRASVPPRPTVANSWQGALVSALTTLLLLIATGTPAHAEANCKNLPSDAQLKALLIAAQAGSPNSPGEAGGIFHGTKMWGAIVNRDSELLGRRVDRRSHGCVAGQSGEREGQGLHRERLQRGRACAVNRSALHLRPARPFAVPPEPLESVRSEVPRPAQGTRGPGRERGHRVCRS